MYLKKPKPSQGMALVAVVFLMVIMSGAVLMMSRLSDMQNAERTLEILSVRAQSAAQAGLEWAVWKIDNAAACVTSPSSLSLSEADLVGFTVSVTCTSTSYTEGLNTITTFSVTSAATYQDYDGGSEYVFRRVSAVIELES